MVLRLISFMNIIIKYNIIIFKPNLKKIQGLKFMEKHL